MGDFRGLFIGLTTIDIQYFVGEFPKPNLKIKSAPPDIIIGGPAANAAVAFAKLNGNANFVSSVGENVFSKLILDDFHQTNVDFADLAGNKIFSPVLATVVTSLKNGDRNIFTHNPEIINSEIDPEHLIETISPHIVMLDGFYPEFGISVAKLAKQKNIPVVLDCGSWKPQYDELLHFADFVICSENFFPQNAVNSQHTITCLQERKVPHFAISRGEKPILFYHNNCINKVKIHQTEVVDSLGAGDVLHGAFCFYYLKCNDFIKALEKASEVATFSCKYKGTRQWINFFHEGLF